MHGMWARIRALVWRGREERELDDEIAFHLEMETEKLVEAGWEPEAARREARLRFGGEERMKERTRRARGWDWLESFVADVRFALRGLRRDRGHTATTGLALALGVAAVTAAYTLVDGILLRPLPYDEADRLVEFRELGEGRRFFPSFPNFLDWRERSTQVEAMVAIQPYGDQPVLDAGPPARVPFLAITRDFVEVVGVELAQGRDLLPEEHVPDGPPRALVSHGFWTERLGSAPMGEATFTAFGSTYEVVGVFAPGFELLYPGDVYLSAERWPNTVRSAHSHRVVARLAPGASPDAADEELDRITADLKAEWGSESNAESVETTPLRDVLLGDQDRQLGLLMAASALVLLIACGNVASATLARGATRRREFAVRRSIGARRGRLVRQLLTESLVLAGVAGAIGVAGAWVAVRLAQAWGGDALLRLQEVQLDRRVLLVSLLATFGTALLSGLYPALRAARSGTAEALKGGGRHGSERRGRLWDGLIVAEVALALILTVGAGLLARSFANIVTLDAGWDPAGLVRIEHTPPNGVFESVDEIVAHFRQVRGEVAAVPGVEAVGLGSLTPLDATAYSAPARVGETREPIPGYVGFRLVDEGYFHALGVELVEGRPFEPGDAEVAVVNRVVADTGWPDGNALGQRIVSNYDDIEREIVGVVDVARDWRFAVEEQPEMFVPMWHAAGAIDQQMSFFVRVAGDADAVIPTLRARILAVNDRVPVEISMLGDRLSRTVADRRFVVLILGLFALSAVALAAIGLWGVVGYSIARRRREIGIRRALGASSPSVRAYFLREMIAPISLGVALGMAGAWLGGGLVESLLYDLDAHDPLVLGAAGVFFTGVAILAVIAPTGRAVRVEPAEVLQE